jgi:hypothetical protein
MWRQMPEICRNEEDKVKIMIAVLLILHGLISAAFSTGSFKPGNSVQNPTWINWWPTNMGESWLLPRPIAESPPVALLGGILFLAGGVALIASGLGLFGWIIPQAWWPFLAVTGAAISLLMLMIYFHPFYLIGIASNLAIIISILWIHWPPLMAWDS